MQHRNFHSGSLKTKINAFPNKNLIAKNFKLQIF